MTCYVGRKTAGLFTNGTFQKRSNQNFTAYSHYTSDSLSNGSCIALLSNNYGGTIIASEAVEVDLTSTYQMSVSVKTIQRSYNNRLGSGHLGFSTYDQFGQFIDLRNCGGAGNTYLTRDLNPGDSFAYVASVSGWSNSSIYYYRHLLLYPATHPYYSTPHYYTRIGMGDYDICHATTWTLTGSGDYQVQLQNTSNVNITMPNIGYATPAGTPVSVGIAGGTYNYAFGAPDYPEQWTTYITPPFSGGTRNSGYPFRQGTKYIRFMNLANYNYRTETAGDSARYLLDNIILVKCPNGQALANSFFSRTSTG